MTRFDLPCPTKIITQFLEFKNQLSAMRAETDGEILSLAALKNPTSARGAA